MLKKQLLKIKRYFAHNTIEKERKDIGLAQFVLLLTLTPFIFSLNLYDVINSESVASKYLIDPDRFESLSYEELLSVKVAGKNKLKKPKEPKVRLSKKQRRNIIKITKQTPESICRRRYPTKQGWIWIPSVQDMARIQLNKQCRVYHKDLRTYSHLLRQYKLAKDKKDVETNYLSDQANNFINSTHIKNAPPTAVILEMSQNHFSNMLNRFSLDEHHDTNLSTEKTDTTTSVENQQEIEATQSRQPILTRALDKLTSASSFQLISYPAWLLGLLLIFPVVFICVKKRAWALLILGLAVPTYNYTLYIISLLHEHILLGYGALGFFQLNSPLFAQIAFVWFLIRGHITSKAFTIFMGILIGSTLLPILLSKLILIDPSHVSHNSYSIVKALLPILIFFIVTAMGRLLVKGAKENLALLKNFGWARNIQSAVHALALWIPMAVLCLPFFYFTQIALPKYVTNELHRAKVLEYSYKESDTILDNALQSVAYRADDINFAWHLIIEERKAYLHTTMKKFKESDFSDAVEKHYDDIVPPTLKLKGEKSDAFLVGWLVDLAAEKSRQSIEKSYANTVRDIKGNIVKLVNQKETEIKAIAEDKKNIALNKIEETRLIGKETILATNTSTQSALWWVFNYVHAAHQLALLLFFFVCFKSYTYVFSRVSFNANTGTTVTLGDSTEKTLDHSSRNSSTSMTACGLDYVINSGKEETFYISRRFQCRGKAPKLCLPQKLRAPFARLINKAYSMNEVTMKKGDIDVSCTATKGVEFFEWDLADGERVIFNFNNYVGMTNGLTLSTLISPRISSLLLGKMIYSQATGPGKLVLMAEGRAEIYNSGIETHRDEPDKPTVNTSKTYGSVPPERIIAMALDSKLHVDSELDIINIYLSSAYVSPVSGRMIVDVDSQRGAKTGLASFVRHFLLPG